MTHASINFDRNGFQEDVNVAFPIDRLRELEADGTIGSTGDFHYAFMGATHPEQMAPDPLTLSSHTLSEPGAGMRTP